MGKKAKKKVISKKLKRLIKKYARALGFAVGFALIGIVVILAIRAATQNASLEPEDGTKTGVTVVNDSTASGDQYVKFGAPPPPTGCAATASTRSLGSLAEYARQGGDQVITIPNGTYGGGGTVSTAHAATSGPCKGWLVLKAQTEGGVTINLNSSALVFNSPASRVAFVGIKFIGDGLEINSTDFFFYRTQHEASGDHSSTDSHLKDFYLNATSVNRIQIFGSLITDACDGLALTGSSNVSVTGSIIRDMYDTDGSGPCHTDHVENFGRLTNWHVTDSWIRGRVELETGPVTGMVWNNVWVSNSVGVGIAMPGDTTGSFTDVRFFDNNGQDVLGSEFGSVSRTRVFCEQAISGCTRAAAPSSPDTNNPGQQWRNAHGISEWENFLL